MTAHVWSGGRARQTKDLESEVGDNVVECVYCCATPRGVRDGASCLDRTRHEMASQVQLEPSILRRRAVRRAVVMGAGPRPETRVEQTKSRPGKMTWVVSVETATSWATGEGPDEETAWRSLNRFLGTHAPLFKHRRGRPGRCMSCSRRAALPETDLCGPCTFGEVSAVELEPAGSDPP